MKLPWRKRTKTPAAKPEPGELPHNQIVTILAALVLSILLAALDQTIVTTALPTIAGELNGLGQISWLVTAYLLAQTASIPLYGKLGDLFGRKRLLLIAIGLFMLGSILSGLAPSMGSLIAFRALQGLGAGGLMVTALSIIGDVVPPRQRGKYMGLLMPVFGLATVFGPTLGGFFIDNLSWRWIFYINIPIGIAALWAVSQKLHLPSRPLGKHKIDYLGALLLAGAVSCLVLLTTWGGTSYAWGSAVIIGLIAGVLGLGGLFIWAETRAHDPVFPLWLFKNQIFLVCVALGMAVGLAMFGAVTYLPTFLQIVTGASATDSGLLMLPLSLGLFVAAIVTGQLMTRTGHYKSFPIIGTALATIGMFLLSTLSATTPQLHMNAYMLVLGVGIGMVMPVITTVAQNAVSRQNLGVATSGVNFFRQIGGAVGVSLAGALFTSRLHTELVKDLPAQAVAQASASGGRINPQTISQLPSAIHDGVVNAFGIALPSVFLDFVPVLAAAFIAALFLKQIPLSNTIQPQPVRQEATTDSNASGP